MAVGKETPWPSKVKVLSRLLKSRSDLLRAVCMPKYQYLSDLTILRLVSRIDTDCMHCFAIQIIVVGLLILRRPSAIYVGLSYMND